MERRDIQKLRSLTTFEVLVDYLRDELDWPIEVEDIDDLVFDYTPEELGIDASHAAKIEAIKLNPPADRGSALGHLLPRVRDQTPADRGHAPHPARVRVAWAEP